MLDIKQEKFEGPLALLLELIEQEELDITQISLAKIADQFVNHMRSFVSTHPDEMADFLVVAARLLLIKSRALLPYLYPEEEEEVAELENQLKMYKEFVEASKKIEALIGKKKFMFGREYNRQAILANMHLFSPPKNLSSEELRMVMSDLILRLAPMQKLEEAELGRKIHIEEKILAIEEMLLSRVKFSFRHMLESSGSRTEMIVSFLAMLELIKQCHITVEQTGLFEDILIEKAV